MTSTRYECLNIFAAATCIVACTPIVVHTEQPTYPASDAQQAGVAALESRRTYAWIPKQPDDPSRDLVPGFRQRVRAVIETALQERGYRPADPDTEPDFYVVYYANVELEQRMWITTWGYSYYPWRPGWDYYWGPWLTYWEPGVAVERYGVGTLVIDAVDPKGRQLLWRGWTRDAAYLNAPEERLLKAARKIVAKLPEAQAPAEPSAAPDVSWYFQLDLRRG